jgi:hypothetical protein
VTAAVTVNARVYGARIAVVAGSPIGTADGIHAQRTRLTATAVGATIDRAGEAVFAVRLFVAERGAAAATLDALIGGAGIAVVARSAVGAAERTHAQRTRAAATGVGTNVNRAQEAVLAVRRLIAQRSAAAAALDALIGGAGIAVVARSAVGAAERTHAQRTRTAATGVGANVNRAREAVLAVRRLIAQRSAAAAARDALVSRAGIAVVTRSAVGAAERTHAQRTRTAATSVGANVNRAQKTVFAVRLFVAERSAAAAALDALIPCAGIAVVARSAVGTAERTYAQGTRAAAAGVGANVNRAQEAVFAVRLLVAERSAAAAALDALVSRAGIAVVARSAVGAAERTHAQRTRTAATSVGANVNRAQKTVFAVRLLITERGAAAAALDALVSRACVAVVARSAVGTAERTHAQRTRPAAASVGANVNRAQEAVFAIRLLITERSAAATALDALIPCAGIAVVARSAVGTADHTRRTQVRTGAAAVVAAGIDRAEELVGVAVGVSQAERDVEAATQIRAHVVGALIKIIALGCGPALWRALAASARKTHVGGANVLVVAAHERRAQRGILAAALRGADVLRALIIVVAIAGCKAVGNVTANAALAGVRGARVAVVAVRDGRSRRELQQV